MWDLPRPGLEPVSPALAGRFSTTAPPGKPLNLYLNTNIAGKGYIVRLEDVGTAGQLSLMFDTGDFLFGKVIKQRQLLV